MGRKMDDRIGKTFLYPLAMAALWTAGGSGAAAQDVVEQVLDSVYTNGPADVAEMLFNDATQRNPAFNEFEVLSGIGGADLKTCKLTAIDGLFCLDGKIVKHWRNPADPSSLESFSCDEIGALDDKKADTCTTLTAGLDGRVWLGGKEKGKAYALIELVELGDSASCPQNQVAGNYCWRQVADGRPLLEALSSIDGDLAEGFGIPGCPAPCPGLLLLEQRTDTAFIDYATETPVLLADKFTWGLKGNDKLQDLTLLQVLDGSVVRNVILATTDSGQVLAYDPAVGGTATSVFNIAANLESTAPCNADDPRYSIEASSKTNLVYVTHSQYCEVMALAEGPGGIMSAGDGLVVASEGAPGSEQPLILSTRDISSTSSIATENVTVAPGISIDLRDCGEEVCPLVVSDAGVTLFSLNGVELASERSGLNLFQITGIPDCRYIPGVCVEDFLDEPRDSSSYTVDVDKLVAAGIIVPRVPPGDPDFYNPAAQRLDLYKLLPLEVTELFEPGEIPPLLLEAYYRAQRANGYRMQAFFGRTEDGVVFVNTFEGSYDVAGLAGSEQGCLDSTTPTPPLTFNDLLEWDVAVTVSERFASPDDAGAGPDPQHVTTIENSGCGSTRKTSTRWSLKPFNLEITPCTFNPDDTDNWFGDGACAAPAAPSAGDTVDDAVFAKLVLALFDELGGTLEQFVCAPGGELVSLSACSTLRADYLNAKDKLDKCWSATQQPKTSAGNQNCQAFESQLSGFQAAVEALPPNPADIANRIGELKARTVRIIYLNGERFAPSVPDGGYVEPQPLP